MVLSVGALVHYVFVMDIDGEIALIIWDWFSTSTERVDKIVVRLLGLNSVEFLFTKKVLFV